MSTSEGKTLVKKRTLAKPLIGNYLREIGEIDPDKRPFSSLGRSRLFRTLGGEPGDCELTSPGGGLRQLAMFGSVLFHEGNLSGSLNYLSGSAAMTSLTGPQERRLILVIEALCFHCRQYNRNIKYSGDLRNRHGVVDDP